MQFLTVAAVVLALAQQTAPDPRAWNEHYKDRAAAALAEQFEDPARAVFRYRAAIAGLLQLKPGMTAAEIGAKSGYLSRVMAQQVAPGGRVFASELDPKMVAYIQARARAEGQSNLVAVQGRQDATGLEPGSIDALAIVNAFSAFSNPRAMMSSVAASMKPGASLLIVDLQREGQGADAIGIDADDLIAIVTAAGFERVSESTVVPGEYAIRFRRQ